MPVGIVPPIGNIALRSGRFSDVEIQIDLTNSRNNMPIQFPFGDGFLPSPMLARWLNQMFVVEAKRGHQNESVTAASLGYDAGFRQTIGTERFLPDLLASDQG